MGGYTVASCLLTSYVPVLHDLCRPFTVLSYFHPFYVVVSLYPDSPFWQVSYLYITEAHVMTGNYISNEKVGAKVVTRVPILFVRVWESQLLHVRYRPKEWWRNEPWLLAYDSNWSLSQESLVEFTVRNWRSFWKCKWVSGNLGDSPPYWIYLWKVMGNLEWDENLISKKRS